MRKHLAFLLACVCIGLYSCSEKNVETAEELFSALRPPIQQKTIDPSQDNLIEGAKGIKIFIPANSLVQKDGTRPAGTVSISLEEFISSSDFFSRRLSTLSGTKLLETGGMINITASANGEPLHVDEESAIIVAFPTKDTLPGMQTFYGDTVSGGGLSWQAASQMSPMVAAVADSSDDGSSFYEKKINVCGYLATVNNKEITWKINHADSTIFNYVEKNLILRDSALCREICESNALLDLILTIDSIGKITGVELKDGPARLLTPMKSFLQNMPAFDMSSMNTTSADAEYNLSICCNKAIPADMFRENFEKKYAAYKDQALKAIGKTELRYYVLSAKKLGWINCDRFYDDPAPKIDFAVTTAGITNPHVMLIFENINSVMQGEEKNGQFVFRNIPVNSKVKVIGIGENNKQAVLAIQSTVVTKSQFTLADYHTFSLEQFQERIK